MEISPCGVLLAIHVCVALYLPASAFVSTPAKQQLLWYSNLPYQQQNPSETIRQPRSCGYTMTPFTHHSKRAPSDHTDIATDHASIRSQIVPNAQIQPATVENQRFGRRNVLASLTSAAVVFVLPDQLTSNENGSNFKQTWLHPQSAMAIDNPLNLKGTFWETGQLYEKSNALLTDDPPETADFIKILETTVESFHSPSLLVDAISEGRYGDASRLLRGGLVSESKIRLAAYALIDSLPEDDENEYLINELFRKFLRYLDVLDAAVEVASRPRLGGEDDPRFNLLSLMGEVEESLEVFVKAVKKGLGI